MKLNFGPRGVIMIDDARIIYRNFEGRGDKYNREGDRNFAVLIDDENIAKQLCEDVNDMGAPWNVKIKDPRDDGDMPFMYLPVKVKFNNRGPNVYLVSGNRRNVLGPESIGMLDQIEIDSVNLDIRPYDDMINGKAFRAAYLQSIEVHQRIDRFAAQYAEEECPEE